MNNGEGTRANEREAGGTFVPFLHAVRQFAPGPVRPPRRWVLVLYDQLRPQHPLLTGPPAETGVIYVETSAKPACRAYHAKSSCSC
jgi:hypothetical protein